MSVSSEFVASPGKFLVVWFDTMDPGKPAGKEQHGTLDAAIKAVDQMRGTKDVLVPQSGQTTLAAYVYDDRGALKHQVGSL